MSPGLPPPMPVIMGPTASGKSDLALRIAERLNGEIVSCDSMQLYRGLEIGCAKPTAAELRRIPHHLVGIFDWHEKGDVHRFVRLADQAIAEIRARGRLPVLAGGTGFYLKALLYGLDDLPGDAALRRELDAEFDNDENFEKLKKLMREFDPPSYERWHNCRRKLIRALEVKKLSGESIVELQTRQRHSLRYEVNSVWLNRPRAELRERIARRTSRMLEAGWVPEARDAIARGLLDTPTAHQALGYAIIGDFLRGKFAGNELSERLATATWQFARRQLTWFRHQHPESRPLEPAANPEDDILPFLNH